jgi:hypothetical protein
MARLESTTDQRKYLNQKRLQKVSITDKTEERLQTLLKKADLIKFAG